MTPAAADLFALEQAEMVKFVLATPRGRAFVWDILAQCNVFGASFTGDPLTTAFAEGRRDIGIRLLRSVLEAEPNVFNVMRAENAEQMARFHVTTSTPEGDFE